MNSQKRIKEGKKRLVLESLSQLGLITHACKQAGIGRTTFYLWCEEDEQFASDAEEAKSLAADNVVKELLHRATGWQKPIRDRQGQLVPQRDLEGNIVLNEDFEPVYATEEVYDSRLLSDAAAALDPRFKKGGSSMGVTVGSPNPGGKDTSGITFEVVFAPGKTEEDYSDDTPDGPDS
jgi:hypothetical protein